MLEHSLYVAESGQTLADCSCRDVWQLKPEEASVALNSVS